MRQAFKAFISGFAWQAVAIAQQRLNDDLETYYQMQTQRLIIKCMKPFNLIWYVVAISQQRLNDVCVL